MRKRLRSALLTLCLCLGLMYVSAGCGEAANDASPSPSESEPQKYTVTFQSGEDTLDDVVVEVVEGGDAAPPDWTLPFKELTGWSRDTSKVDQDMTVRAQWASKAMTGVEISEYAETRTVTVRIHDGAYDHPGSGSGFFIDDQGTLITNYHVIEYADSLEVQLANAVYDVTKIVNFSEKYDLAILKVDIEGNDYFDTATDTQKGEQVYAVGSALGELTDTMTSGIVSHTSREMGVIDCIQTDAAISHGNSGGPLINQYGQVIGINSYSISSGSNLNMAIKISMLDKLGTARDYSLADYVEWWKMETSRSYHPTELSDTDYYKYSLINTYQNYTGADCIFSTCSFTFADAQEDYVLGYNDAYWVFVYPYEQDKYDTYVAYLKELGFVYDPDTSGTYPTGDKATYYSSSSDFEVDLVVTNERGDWSGRYLLIRTIY